MTSLPAKMNTEMPLREEADYARDLRDNIVAVVARFYKISIKEMKRRTRKASIAVPRQAAIYLIRDITGLSFQDSAKKFSQPRHTYFPTIRAHAVKDSARDQPRKRGRFVALGKGRRKFDGPSSVIQKQK